MQTTTTTPSQSRAFTTIFLIEMWERFGFYGMQALIVYYMVQRLGFPDERATLGWGFGAIRSLQTATRSSARGARCCSVRRSSPSATA